MFGNHQCHTRYVRAAIIEPSFSDAKVQYNLAESKMIVQKTNKHPSSWRRALVVTTKIGIRYENRA